MGKGAGWRGLGHSRTPQHCRKFWICASQVREVRMVMKRRKVMAAIAAPMVMVCSVVKSGVMEKSFLWLAMWKGSRKLRANC